MKIKYFDNAATTAVDKDIINYMMPYFNENYYNPSSLYTPARESINAIEEARKKVAYAINSNTNEIYFTSGGTESNNFAIKGFAYANKKKGNHIITSSIEHPSVINTCKTLEKEGFEITYLNVDNNGLINLKDLEKNIKENTILISIMTANNEIGTIQPIKKIGDIAKAHNIVFHTDAVQAIGSLNIDVKEMNINMLSLSGHKFYGPKGIGALYIKKGTIINRVNDGGHQENNKRAGTENVPNIVGLGFAIEKAYKELDNNVKKITELRDYYITEIEKKIKDVILNGDRINRLPGNANFSFKHIEGESILSLLDSKGICVSTGSACSSKSLEPSYVLLSIGLPHEIAHGSIRVSIGKHNTKEEVDFLIESIIEVVNTLRKISPLYEEN